MRGADQAEWENDKGNAALRTAGFEQIVAVEYQLPVETMNAAFRPLENAMAHYTAAIEHQPRVAKFFSNRSLARLQWVRLKHEKAPNKPWMRGTKPQNCEEWILAKADAQTCIDIEPVCAPAPRVDVRMPCWSRPPCVIA